MGRHAAQTSAVSTLTIPTMTSSGPGTFFEQHSASSFSVAASQQQQQQLALRTNRPVWKRLTRTISHAFLATKSKKKTKKRDVSDPSPATLDLVSNKEKQRQGEHINMSTHSLVKLAESTTATQEVQADLCKHDEEIYSSRFGETTPAPVTRGDASNVCERQNGATHIVALVTMIPPEYPLVRYIAESLFAEVDLPCQAAPDDGNSIEWRLFVKCIELQKWSLAFVLAEKMQRNHTMQPQQRRREALMQDRAVSADGDDNEAENDDADERDGILDFLDTCSA
uniref:Uncharacterized protein n=1 Tax=Globisporangium ultimum (strain ATCC 200006 / CBS 805.95 / DAOM BR144) TaxID=431595 RepID=K3WGN6_GLOUD